MPEVLADPPAMTVLDLYRGNLNSLALAWTALHDDELRRRAVRAAGDKDIPELVSLTTAYLGGTRAAVAS